MSTARFYKSAPDNWTAPRPFSDASVRMMKYGRIRPMEEPGFFERWFGRR